MTLTADDRLAAKMRRNALAVLPVPVVLGLAALTLVGPPPLLPLLLGAAGWLLALVVRQPVALIAARSTSPSRAATIVGWFSGPAEELVRLALVLVALRSFEDAVWAGFGWATIEVLLIVVNGFAIAGLMTKDDPKSVEARELLAAQGMLGAQHPVWGVLERVSATALHTGFTLLLLAQPWLVLVTLPAHSVVNMLMAQFAKAHLAWAEGAFAVVAAIALAAGVLLAAG
ncbi:hypothetical protein [Agrococcus sp. DT81.2]|uniref:hypothetical protein n=1 Tax=Agrococcus sp. DT81.2 TaxID=3393414 RepID=UPI003CE50CD3